MKIIDLKPCCKGAESGDHTRGCLLDYWRDSVSDWIGHWQSEFPSVRCRAASPAGLACAIDSYIFASLRLFPKGGAQ